MTQKLTKLIEAIGRSYDVAMALEHEVLTLCENSFCAALREHSDLSEAAIKQAWLKYRATELDFKV